MIYLVFTVFVHIYLYIYISQKRSLIFVFQINITLNLLNKLCSHRMFNVITSKSSQIDSH